MPLLARGPGFGIKKISVLLALVTYFSMMQYSVWSKILSEKKVFLSTFHRCFRRNFNPVYFQIVSGSVGPDSHAALWFGCVCGCGKDIRIILKIYAHITATATAYAHISMKPHNPHKL